MNEDRACAAIKLSRWQRSSVYVHKLVRRLRRWIFINVWCLHLYRPAMRLMHRYNLHYAPATLVSTRYGKRDLWCQWCGLRGNVWGNDPEKPVLLRKQDCDLV
jgi:hypothetical protein